MRIANLAILGGSGFLGRSLVARLVERSGGAGGRLVVPTRRLQRGRAILSLPTVEMVEADVLDEFQLGACLRGCDAAINLVAILHGDEAEFERVHVELPRHLAQVCVETGVRRVVHVSALGAAPDAPSMYLRSKARGEAALRAAAGIDLTVLRPSVMFGADDRLLNSFAMLQRWLPIVPLASPNARFQPVWVEDVARAIVHCLDRPATIGQTFECTGPEVLSLRELVQAAGRWAGQARPVLPLPAVLGRAQAALLEQLPGPMMSRDNLDSMRVPSIAGGQLPGLGSLGIQPTALEAVAPQYLGAAFAGRGRLNALRASARRG